ncbi:hypothetical protein EVJ58_g1197 [Rhodofomes roseus]|uniref:Uncharacterized protein n=1 Tax=Rhodofomes roseus TaxID=34475 RepID=A0A4Y9Z0P5_9APHY|nr:hypothetical protein EVJ58_g1197 [Rhodofomes roseus]
MGIQSASIGSGRGDVAQPVPSTIISALGAEGGIMERSRAILHRRINPVTPYHPDAWHRMLQDADLLAKYPSLVDSMRSGFNIGIPPIYITRCPDNSSTIEQHSDVLARIIQDELQKRRYIGPFSQQELEALIGPFQSSPLSLVPKPHKPGTFRLVQNFSYPHSPRAGYIAINDSLRADDFPCTWGTFTAMCLMCSRLPPGSQAAVRDVAEAYRTVPLHPSQWPGTVIRISASDQFIVDPNAAFGAAPNAGLYGNVADAGTDIMRHRGLGPIAKWVDDHTFFRILCEFIDGYNRGREQWRKQIEFHGGEHKDRGRLWYGGDRLPDGRVDEFVEDMRFPVRDLSKSSERSPEDARYSCCMVDIDAISRELGIPWQTEKDVPFSHEFPFTGFLWNLETREVSLPPAKAAKYRQAITEWRAPGHRTHTLEEVQKLYGKLLHASLVVPAGRCYLTELESMLGIFHSNPFMPRTPPRGTPADLDWWLDALSQPSISRAIPGPLPVIRLDAFSDASSGTGIAIVIGDRWRAWTLQPGWERDGRDIGWAESVGFELLVRCLLACAELPQRIRLFGDNMGVVGGWKKGCSKSRPVNSTFKRIHRALAGRRVDVFLSYVPSGHNPADDPSRGRYPPAQLLLPPVPIPDDIQPFLADVILDGPNQFRHAACVQRPKCGQDRGSGGESCQAEGVTDDFLWQHIGWDD